MEIDMSKPFILFAGDNGTGKTYAATFLYTLILKLRGLLLKESDKLDNPALPIHTRFENAVEGEIKADELYDFLDVFLRKHQKEIVNSMNLNINTDSFKCEIATSKEEWKGELWDFKNWQRIGIPVKSMTAERLTGMHCSSFWKPEE